MEVSLKMRVALGLHRTAVSTGQGEQKMRMCDGEMGGRSEGK